MTGDQSAASASLLALGSAELMKGFALIGFETIADADINDLRKTIDRLTRKKQRALLIVEHYLAKEGHKLLQPIFAEGGGIVVVEVPPITSPEDLVSVVSEKVKNRLGDTALGETA